MTSIGRRLRLGTRGSLLAVAQSRLIEQALRAEYADLHIDIVKIGTSGDRDLVTPLDQVGDPDFFSAELDRALLDGRIDFTVHSMKDLADPRPDNLYRTAVPRREDPRDVIVFRDDISARLRSREVIRIGTSSARRQQNVANFLAEHLPQQGCEFEFVPLRGPVDRRVARIAGDPSAPDALDGVVLALAGLARLWRDPDGHRALQPQLGNARWMILPLSECPAAPAQGALALECREDDAATRALLARLHDAETAALVQMELEALHDQPASLQSAFGATAIRHSTLGPVLFRRGGRDPEKRVVWRRPDRPADAGRSNPWDGGIWQGRRRRRALRHDLKLGDNPAVFVAHWFAASDALADRPDARTWVSGTASWRKLAEQGYWVEGCADNLGFADVTPTLGCEVLQLPAVDQWTVLTRAGAEPGWRSSGVGHICATYELDDPDTADLEELTRQVGSATDFFWGSIEQYRAVAPLLPGDARHACGAGKTAGALRSAGVDAPLVFPSRSEWQAWLR